MTTPYSRAVTAGLAALDRSAAISVTYRTPNGTTFTEVSAVVGKTPLRTLGQRDVTDLQSPLQGATLLVRNRDFLIDVDQLPDILPTAGDRITTASGDIYEVLPFGGEPEFRYSDHAETRYRIHAQLIS